MHGTTIDRRVKKTKKQLRLALMHLMTQKSAKSISVRELAEQADINRSTFYIHYKDVNDLLLHLEDEMAERLSELCRRHDPKDSMTGGYPFLTDLYAFIQENADLCKVLLGGYGDRAYTERICRILRDDFIEAYLSLLCPGDREKIHYFCAFIVPGNLMLALRWLQDGTRESPEEIARFAGQFINSGWCGKAAKKRHIKMAPDKLSGAIFLLLRDARFISIIFRQRTAPTAAPAAPPSRPTAGSAPYTASQGRSFRFAADLPSPRKR